jgi:hypothetical protein
MRQFFFVLSITLLSSLPFHASAVLIGGVEFPQGLSSFADSVSNFTNGTPSADAEYLGADNALGAPDFNGVTNCADQASCTFLSLGNGGSVVFQFIDNYLTGSGNNDLDLWIFEVGPDVEDTFVEVSSDGIIWTDVGKVFGATSGIDIDQFGFDPSSILSYVRLTDDPNEGNTSGRTPGADIDSVGAITSVFVPSTPPPTPAPEPSILLLFAAGLVGLRFNRKNNKTG